VRINGPEMVEGEEQEAQAEGLGNSNAYNMFPPELAQYRGRFGTAQVEDRTLQKARQNVKVINGVPVNPAHVLTFPHFSMGNHLLYTRTLSPMTSP
jgi:hypothetical protein